MWEALWVLRDQGRLDGGQAWRWREVAEIKTACKVEKSGPAGGLEVNVKDPRGWGRLEGVGSERPVGSPSWSH